MRRLTPIVHAADPVEELATEFGISSAGLAMAWVMNQPAVTAPIIGISKPSSGMPCIIRRGSWIPNLESELA